MQYSGIILWWGVIEEEKKSPFPVILLVHMILNRWQPLNEPLFPRVTLCLQNETRKNLETPITFVLHRTCAPLHLHLSFSLGMEAKKALYKLKWYLVIVKRVTVVHQMPSFIFMAADIRWLHYSHPQFFSHFPQKLLLHYAQTEQMKTLAVMYQEKNESLTGVCRQTFPIYNTIIIMCPYSTANCKLLVRGDKLVQEARV